MGNISVSVQIPALHQTYDFIVPNNMSVRDVQQLMLKILNSEYGISDKNTDVMLFDKKEGSVLSLECSFAQLAILDGAQLCMM